MIVRAVKSIERLEIRWSENELFSSNKQIHVPVVDADDDFHYLYLQSGNHSLERSLSTLGRTYCCNAANKLH